MKVTELMRTDVTSVDPGSTIGDVVLLLAEGHISGMPVIDTHHRILGVISATDVLRAEADCTSPEARERLFEDTTVAELMTSPAATITPYADIREAAQHMLYLEVHRLFVEEDKKLVGVISQTDVVRAVASFRVRA
jgi:CBS domain-containing membrane protein